MNELALFAGAGGGILGGHLLGWRTVCAVEWEAYPASVLVARQNDKILPPFPIWDDVQTFDGKPWQGIVDVISGGFPCQDISAAGGGAGIDGKKSGMWREMARIIGEVRPKYAFVENSPMLTTRGLGTVLRDLAEMGYDAEWGVLGAADVGANHQRDRIWIVAKQRDIFSHTEHNRVGWGEQQSESIEKTNGTMANSKKLFGNGGNNNTRISMEREKESKLRNNSWSENVANSNGIGQSRQGSHGKSIGQETIKDRQASVIGPICESDFWSVEPRVGRVVDGMAARVDRLKAIGNGQVPLCAATAWTILMERINGL